MKFEYQVRAFPIKFLEEVLNEWGAAGWDAIKIADLDEFTQSVQVIFKREKR